MEIVKIKDMKLDNLKMHNISAVGNITSKFGGDKLFIETEDTIYVLPINRHVDIMSITKEEFDSELSTFKTQIKEHREFLDKEEEMINGL